MLAARAFPRSKFVKTLQAPPNEGPVFYPLVITNHTPRHPEHPRRHPELDSGSSRYENRKIPDKNPRG